MSRIQEQTRSEAESEYWHKGGGNNLLTEISFQKETRDDAQEGKAIPRISRRLHITCAEFSMCLCGRGRGGVHASTQAKIRTPSSSGNPNSLQSPEEGSRKLLWAVYERAGPSPHICGPVVGSCPWTDAPYTKGTRSQHRALMNYSWAQESSSVRKPSPLWILWAEDSSFPWSPPSVMYSVTVLLLRGLWKPH